ncbi:hypothetical protein DL93DRAFT_1921968 [Clavulina sp. PMI_390]|nr:hypothetical protein DL93DRAFT_1921968 [Clavulina sp. PMI_390]
MHAWFRDLSLPLTGTPPRNLILPESIKRYNHEYDNDHFKSPLSVVDKFELLECGENPTVASPLQGDSHSFDYRAQYYRIMRMRQRMRQYPVMCKDRIAEGILPEMRHGQFRDIALSPDGDVLVLWQKSSLQIIDFRTGEKHHIPLQSLVNVWDEGLIAVDNFQYEGRVGVLIAASFLVEHQINLLFFPFSCGPSALLHLADLRAPDPSKITAVFFSGSYLIIIIVTARGTVYYIRIADLAQGVNYLVHVEVGE